MKLASDKKAAAEHQRMMVRNAEFDFLIVWRSASVFFVRYSCTDVQLLMLVLWLWPQQMVMLVFKQKMHRKNRLSRRKHELKYDALKRQWMWVIISLCAVVFYIDLIFTRRWRVCILGEIVRKLVQCGSLLNTEMTRPACASPSNPNSSEQNEGLSYRDNVAILICKNTSKLQIFNTVYVFHNVNVRNVCIFKIQSRLNDGESIPVSVWYLYVLH